MEGIHSVLALTHTLTHTHYKPRRTPLPRYVLNESGKNADRLKGEKQKPMPDISFGW